MPQNLGFREYNNFSFTYVENTVDIMLLLLYAQCMDKYGSKKSGRKLMLVVVYEFDSKIHN
jgi:hypothetical protein